MDNSAVGHGRCARAFGEAIHAIWPRPSIWCLLLSFLFLLCTDALATVRFPVNVTIASGDQLQAGQRMTIYIVLEPLADISDANFQLIIPEEGWEFIGGQTEWAGSLKKGEPVQFEAYVIPTSEKPELLRGLINVPGRGVAGGVLDMSRLGGRTPEQDLQTQILLPELPQGMAEEVPLLRPQWEEGLPVPAPERPRKPRIPGAR